ncbi:nuclear transport factor 2 family protein [Variovorax sp. EL159]|uniref:nuclear transport factor 2 family protein n=1 Tax=Variovorax sp. EL159 TaxID=1566270 RepID=UPI00088E152B|nr:nuclear transport factor 2 family protein [Variovorax sp. EL159]SCX72585.1 protein of unknown function [Variovorax sp. EL159]
MTKVERSAVPAEQEKVEGFGLDVPMLELAEQLEGQRWLAMLDGNHEALSRLVSEDLWYVHSSGLKDGKKGYVDSVKTGLVVYQSSKRQINTVIRLGDQAFLAGGEVVMDAVIRGVQKRLQSLFSVTWRQEQGIWRLVAHQTTLLPL